MIDKSKAMIDKSKAMILVFRREMIIQEGKTPRKQGLRRDVTKKIAEMQGKTCLFIIFAGQKEKRSYEKDIVCMSRKYLS